MLEAKDPVRNFRRRSAVVQASEREAVKVAGLLEGPNRRSNRLKVQVLEHDFVRI